MKILQSKGGGTSTNLLTYYFGKEKLVDSATNLETIDRSKAILLLHRDIFKYFAYYTDFLGSCLLKMKLGDLFGPLFALLA